MLSNFPWTLLHTKAASQENYKPEDGWFSNKSDFAPCPPITLKPLIPFDLLFHHLRKHFDDKRHKFGIEWNDLEAFDELDKNIDLCALYPEA